MAYTFKYQLNSAPQSSKDGSGMVNHSITAIAYNGDGEVVPSRSKTFCVPATELQTVMDMPDATGPERTVKNTAYKSALVANINTQPLPITGWSVSALTELMEMNDVAESVAVEANDYITVTLAQSYPVEFSL